MPGSHRGQLQWICNPSGNLREFESHPWPHRFMKRIILILVLIFTLCSITESEPSWYPEEKYRPAAHFILSAGATITSYYILDLIWKDCPEKTLGPSILIGLVPGVAKEIWDGSQGHDIDTEDIMYDMLGTWTGALIINFSIIRGRNERKKESNNDG